MEAVRRGGDRQELHERLRVHARASAETCVASTGGAGRPLRPHRRGLRLRPDARRALEDVGRPESLVGRSAEQVEAFVREELEPALAGATAAPRARPSACEAGAAPPAPACSSWSSTVACASRAASRPVSKPVPPSEASLGLERGRPRVLVRRRRRVRGKAHGLRRDLRLLADDRGAPRPAPRHDRAT